jgi:hypothetical protein
MKLPISNSRTTRIVQFVAFDVSFNGMVNITDETGQSLGRFLSPDLAYIEFFRNPDLPFGGNYSFTHMSGNQITRLIVPSRFGAQTVIPNNPSLQITSAMIDTYPVFLRSRDVNTILYTAGDCVIGDSGGVQFIVGSKNTLGPITLGTNLVFGGYDNNRVTFQRMPVTAIIPLNGPLSRWRMVRLDIVSALPFSVGFIQNWSPFNFLPAAGSTFTGAFTGAFFTVADLLTLCGLPAKTPGDSVFVDIGGDISVQNVGTVNNHSFEGLALLSQTGGNFGHSGGQFSMNVNSPGYTQKQFGANPIVGMAQITQWETTQMRWLIQASAFRNAGLPIPVTLSLNTNFKNGSFTHWRNQLE